MIRITGTMAGVRSSGTAARGCQNRGINDYRILYCFGDDGIIDGKRIKNEKEAEIDENGEFTFEIPEGNCFTAFLVDPNAEFRKILGLAGIGTGSNSCWEAIDTERIKGDISLGRISPDAEAEELLLSEKRLSDFAAQIENPEEVKKLSLIDDSVRMKKNIINTRGVLEDRGVSYVFKINDMSEVTDRWTLAGRYTFSGFQTFAQAPMLNEGDSVEMIPPSPVSFGNGTEFSDASPVPGRYFNGHFEFGLGDTARELFQTAPPGYWQLCNNGMIIAELDFGCIQPTVNGKITFPHVIPKLNTVPERI